MRGAVNVHVEVALLERLQLIGRELGACGGTELVALLRERHDDLSIRARLAFMDVRGRRRESLSGRRSLNLVGGFGHFAVDLLLLEPLLFTAGTS